MNLYSIPLQQSIVNEFFPVKTVFQIIPNIEHFDLLDLSIINYAKYET
jgi:hypothetical protein